MSGGRDWRAQRSAVMTDKKPVSRLLQDTEGLFSAAQRVAAENAEPAEFSVLVGPCGVRVIDRSAVSGGDWPLESLRLHHGCEAAYRVTRSGGSVRVEGCNAGQTCTLSATQPRQLLNRQPVGYRLVAAPESAQHQIDIL